MSKPLAGTGGVYALLSDGTTALIRQATPDDFDAVKAMHEQMSPANSYLRFFSLSRTAPEREASRICREPDDNHAALLAIYDSRVAGVASYEVMRDSRPGEAGEAGRTAEVAFAVAEFMHQKGIATLLLEHLVSFARARKLTAFTADTLSENTGMLRVFSDAGLPVRTRRE
ncbi:MAG: GNAT family N-acetyltransferase, partial [Streptosporangiales bacterium]|nr:GNAT family N-acetyltransferase [Streptosporangiales bacterium]